MIQVHTSKALAVDLAGHLTEAPRNPGAMQWYAHRVHVLRHKCVIVMEAESRYAMVFTGLTKPDFQRFPDLFSDRLIREALSICQLDDDQTGRLGAIATLVTEPVQILPGYDLSVQAHINEVVREMEWTAYEAGTLPEHDGHEFSFGLRMNQTPRKRKGDKDYFYPLEIMRAFWLGLLEHVSARPDNQAPLHKPALH